MGGGREREKPEKDLSVRGVESRHGRPERSFGKVDGQQYKMPKRQQIRRKQRSRWMWCLFQNIFQWNYGNRSFIKVNGIVNGG